MLMLANGPLEEGFVLLDYLVEGWLQGHHCNGGIELKDWLLPETTRHGMMMTGARYCFQMSRDFASLGQTDVDEYGEDLEKDMPKFVLTSDFHLVVGPLWFGRQSLYKQAQS